MEQAGLTANTTDRTVLAVDRTRDELGELLASHKWEPSDLIPVLQEMQRRWGYLPLEAMRAVARFLRLPESTVYGVATFYAQFSFARQGEHIVKVCLGTACHVRGGPRILEAVERELNIRPGETTPDYKFSLQRVACFGSCALGPVVVVDDRVYGRMTPPRVRAILAPMK